MSGTSDSSSSNDSGVGATVPEFDPDPDLITNVFRRDPMPASPPPQAPDEGEATDDPPA